MHKINDLTGLTFGHLKVINFVELNKWHKAIFLVQCLKCTSLPFKVIGGDLVRGHTTSCGCERKNRLFECNFKDLAGQTFNWLYVIKFVRFNEHHQAIYLVQCECGSRPFEVLGYSLSSNNTKSCGCYNRKMAASRCVQLFTSFVCRVCRSNIDNNHAGLGGVHHTCAKLSQSFRDMKSRCYNCNHIDFALYGGRGIKISPIWLMHRNLFYEWSFSQEWSPSKEIHRINNNKCYSPENCVWLTKTEHILIHHK